MLATPIPKPQFLLLILITSKATFLSPPNTIFYEQKHFNTNVEVLKQLRSKRSLNNSGEAEVFLTSIGGVGVEVNQYPFVVSIRFVNKYLCSGVILNSNQVITTAHTFRLNIPLKIYTVHAARTKKYGVEDTEQVFKIVKILIHPNYNKGIAYDNDVVIVTLNATINFNSMAQPAALPAADEVLPINSYCCMVGWGETLGYGHPNLLNEACFPSWKHEKCNHRDFYGGRISTNMICAGEELGGIDSCRGDSGGPLQCTVGQTQKVWGLVSWGIGCAEINKPGVYVNLAKYRNWIQQNSKI